MKVQKHTHRVKLHRYNSGNAIFHCTLPDCYFKLQADLALGKKFLCWRCGKDFIVDEITIRLVKPHCRNCTVKKNNIPRIDELLSQNVQEQIEQSTAEQSITERLQSLNNPSRASILEMEQSDDDI